PVNLKVLQELSGALLDLHQQFDTLETHSSDFQLHMLDALAGNKDLLAQYQGLYKNYTRNKRQLEELLLQHQKSQPRGRFF
ncbi:MAG: DNA repair protein RecN, partial [Saprospiraceae bacterium]|nr:DNA repair protein RecN [Saprospiraceae bacterium]